MDKCAHKLYIMQLLVPQVFKSGRKMVHNEGSVSILGPQLCMGSLAFWFILINIVYGHSSRLFMSPTENQAADRQLATGWWTQLSIQSVRHFTQESVSTKTEQKGAETLEMCPKGG